MAFNASAFLQTRQAGANALAAGISSAGNSIAAGITEHTKQAKKLKALQGSAVDIFGMDKNKVAQMSAEDLEQQLGDSIIKQQMERAAAAEQRQQQDQEFQMERAAAAEQRQQQDQEFQMAQRAAGQQFQKRLSPMPPGMEGPEQPLSPQRLMAAAAETGYQLDPRVIAQFAKESEGTDWNNVMPRPFEIEGVKGAVGKSGQFQFLPQATPESLQAIPVQDEEGNVIGMRVPTGKGGTAAMPSPRAAKTLPDSYYSDLSKLQGEITTARVESAKTDKDLEAPWRGKRSAADIRKQLNDRITANEKNLRSHVNRYKRQGYADESFWRDEEQTLGINKTDSPAAKPAQGGYKIGTRYSGLTYMGGDPKQESSWQK